MVNETEKKELERIKAKYQNNLGTDYSSSHDVQSLAQALAKSLVLGHRQYLKLPSQNSPDPKLTRPKTHQTQNSLDQKLGRSKLTRFRTYPSHG